MKQHPWLGRRQSNVESPHTLSSTATPICTSTGTINHLPGSYTDAFWWRAHSEIYHTNVTVHETCISCFTFCSVYPNWGNDHRDDVEGWSIYKYWSLVRTWYYLTSNTYAVQDAFNHSSSNIGNRLFCTLDCPCFIRFIYIFNIWWDRRLLHCPSREW